MAMFLLLFSTFVVTAQSDQAVCPDNFPTVERHTEANHGDMCRNKKIHGFNVGWVCPVGCKESPTRSPYCSMSASSNTPCRIKNVQKKSTTTTATGEVNNGFEEFIVDVKETCDNKFKIGESTFNKGEDTCRERCRSDPDCNYYFYTSKETCNDFFESYMALNCDLYKDCSKRRTPGCNGRTFRKTDGWYAVGG